MSADEHHPLANHQAPRRTLPARSSTIYHDCIEQVKAEPYDADVEYVMQLTAPSTLTDVEEETAKLIVGMIKEDMRRY